jgi:orotidine-5'-phosphate decarboxylase
VDPRDRLIVALDTATLAEAESLTDRFAGAVRWFKIGPHLFTGTGPAAVAATLRRGKVFLDLKFHDIPSVVASGVVAAARLGASLCTVHALGGSAMLAAAVHAASEAGPGPRGERMRVVAVTLLTSSDATTVSEVGMHESPAAATLRLARLAQAAELDGAVVSPLEAAAVRQACGPDFLLICPGIRPAGVDAGDQRRTDTPAAAIAAGADMLVVGRAITRARDPRSAAEEVVREIGSAERR